MSTAPQPARRCNPTGSVRDTFGNALAEPIIGHFKNELVHCLGPCRSMHDLDMDTLGWADWFNDRHLLGLIGSIRPAEAEENFYAQHDILDMVA